MDQLPDSRALNLKKGPKICSKLAHIVAPEDIKQNISDLILTKAQEDEIEKMTKAIQYRDYLKRIGLREIGKLLFVGPPGTGKTSGSRAIQDSLRSRLLK